MCTFEGLASARRARLVRSSGGRALLTPLIAATMATLLLLPVPAGALPTIVANATFGDWGAVSSGVTLEAFAFTDGPTPLALDAVGITTRVPQISENPPVKLAAYSDPFLGSAQAAMSFTGTVSNGVIHETATGTTTATPGPGGQLGFDATASIHGALASYDTIKVVGPANLDVLLIGLHTAVQQLAAVSTLAGADLTNTVQISDNTPGSPARGKVVFDLTQCLQTGVPPNACPTQKGPTIGALTVQPGEQFVVFDELTFEGESSVVANVLKSNFVMNLADSAYFTIDPQTAGAIVETGSGINYSSSVFPPSPSSGVPEPPTLALLLLSMGVFTLARGTRRIVRSNNLSASPPHG
jgi:hypothetical protein